MLSFSHGSLFIFCNNTKVERVLVFLLKFSCVVFVFCSKLI